MVRQTGAWFSKDQLRVSPRQLRVMTIEFQLQLQWQFGGWDSETVKLLKAMAAHCALRKSLPPAVEIKQFLKLKILRTREGRGAIGFVGHASNVQGVPREL